MSIEEKTRGILMEALFKELPIAAGEYEFRGKRPGLVVIDEVNGFCTPGMGNLAPPEGVQPYHIDIMISLTAQAVREFDKAGWPILALCDTHEEGRPEPPYPPHCVHGTGEESLVPELSFITQLPSAMLLRKDCINGFIGGIRSGGRNLVIDWLNNEKIETLVVAGICTDICDSDFVCTMLSARNHYLEYGNKLLPYLQDVVAYVPACATYDLPIERVAALGIPSTAAHPRSIANYIGLWTMQSRGAILASHIRW